MTDEKEKPKRTREMVVGAILAAVLGGGGAAYELDLIPDWVLRHEHDKLVGEVGELRVKKTELTEFEKLAGEVKRLRYEVLQRGLESDELKVYRLEETKRRLKKAGEDSGPVDGQIRILKTRTRRARIILEKMDKE